MLCYGLWDGKENSTCIFIYCFGLEKILMVDFLRVFYKKEILYVFCVYICNIVGKVYNYSCREIEEDV